MPEEVATAPAPVPLCVDLDGTLVRTDMLHETLLLLAKSSPASLAALPGWLARGKAGFKHLIAARVAVDASGLPYRTDILTLIEQARAEGRPVVLATASPTKVATAIAEHLGVFDAVLSSDEGTNLSARAKADLLVERFGERGFDYIGNDTADLPVFARARRAFLVSSRGGLRRAAARGHDDVTFLDDPVGGLRAWAKALRIHQWLKNLLVFVPLVAAHQLLNLPLLGVAILAFLSYSLCASSVYLLNDLLDLPSDRAHRKKKNRPFASGALPVKAGIVAAPVLLASSIALAFFVPPRFLAVLAIYYLLTVLYSFFLKKQVVVDVMLLAGLYTLRIIAGAAATGIKPSFWLLALSMFTFLSLAMVKRYSELRIAMASAKPLAGRGYHPDDLPVVLALGSSSGMVSVLILALYTQAEIVPDMYPAPEWLWLAPPLMLYWTARLWMKAQRGEVDDDPVVFAARDWQSLAVVTLMGASFLLATSGWSIW
ncbi:MAG: UbiA family prenyltransferase [Sphingomonadales bacterium]|nr:UbiA family prenyltransferase [Sphingomonadales bacterium]